MSEKITHHERENHHGSLEHINKPEQTSERAEQKDSQKDSLESIRSSIEQHAQKTEAIKHNQDKNEYVEHRASSQSIKKMKQEAYQNSLKNTQKKLSPPSRIFSKVIHSRFIETPSEALEKTVARPQAILFGGVFALIGSALLYFMAKRYGFTYNFLVYAILYIAFYGVGLLVELMIRQAQKIINK